jgi:phosphatidate cytidylyltransferase
MLRQRLLVALLIVPPGLLINWAGGWLFFITMLVIVSIGAYEYTQLMKQNERRPSQVLLVWGALALNIARALPFLLPALQPFQTTLNDLTVAFIILAVTAWHVRDYERGATTHAATDWALTLAGIFYIGWLCSFYLLIRYLPDGLWWIFLTLAPIWLADSGAYTMGRWLGKHPLTPRLSPKKTWEGFIGGVLWGIVFGGVFGILGQAAITGGLMTASTVNMGAGAILGFIGGVLGTLGDLTISMLKREAGLKDSGVIFGAHGGMLDRIDSWVLAGPIFYYLITLVFLK